MCMWRVRVWIVCMWCMGVGVMRMVWVVVMRLMGMVWVVVMRLMGVRVMGMRCVAVTISYADLVLRIVATGFASVGSIPHGIHRRLPAPVGIPVAGAHAAVPNAI